jgi:hypothetical protein
MNDCAALLATDTHSPLGKPFVRTRCRSSPNLEFLHRSRDATTAACRDVSKPRCEQLLCNRPPLVIALPRRAKRSARPQHLLPALWAAVAWGVSRPHVHEWNLRGPSTREADPLVVRGCLLHHSPSVLLVQSLRAVEHILGQPMIRVRTSSGRRRAPPPAVSRMSPSSRSTAVDLRRPRWTTPRGPQPTDREGVSSERRAPSRG